MSARQMVWDVAAWRWVPATPADRRRARDVEDVLFAVPCPRCATTPLHPCLMSNGGVRWLGPHEARLEDAALRGSGTAARLLEGELLTQADTGPRGRVIRRELPRQDQHMTKEE